MVRQSVFALLGTGLLACVVNTSPASQAVYAPGRLTVQWTVEGTYDPNLCNATGAVSIRLDVGGGTYVQSCSAFATTLDLPEGRYSARATLTDAAGNARTTAVDIPPITLIAGSNATIAVDFPASSFF